MHYSRKLIRDSKRTAVLQYDLHELAEKGFRNNSSSKPRNYKT
jgi:hypothetical protein